MVTLEELVPKNHLPRQIDAAVDFEFIRTKVAHLYCAFRFYYAGNAPACASKLHPRVSMHSKSTARGYGAHINRVLQIIVTPLPLLELTHVSGAASHRIGV